MRDRDHPGLAVLRRLLPASRINRCIDHQLCGGKAKVGSLQRGELTGPKAGVREGHHQRAGLVAVIAPYPRCHVRELADLGECAA